MRIGIDARESGTSTGRYVDGLIEHLAKLKSPHKFVILTRSDRLDYMKQIAPAFEIVRCDVKEFTLREQYSLVWQLYGLRLDLVHFPAAQQPLLFFGNSLTTIQDLTTARFRNPAKNLLVFKYKQMVYRWLVRRVAHRAKDLVAISDWVKYDLANFAAVPLSKITTIYPSYGTIEAAAEPYPALKGQRFIMYLGRPLPHKNLQRLVEAFAILKPKHPELKLVLVGKNDANFAKLKAFVRSQGISDVIFTGWLPDSQAKWLYQQAAAYVVPSLSEGFGMPGLEAMAYGVPVISSSATCSPEVYKNGALYFDPYDADDMAAKIEMVLDDKKLAADLIAKGHKITRLYSWEDMAKQVLKTYDQVLSDSSNK